MGVTAGIWDKNFEDSERKSKTARIDNEGSESKDGNHHSLHHDELIESAKTKGAGEGDEGGEPIGGVEAPKHPCANLGAVSPRHNVLGAKSAYIGPT